MKNSLLAFCLLFFTNLIWAQERALSDTNEVIKIAKKRCSYWENEDNKPFIKLNENTSEWIVQSTKYSNTRKGDCKHTNGCTKVKTVKLTIDAKTGKVKSKVKENKIYPNYE
jgi:uncharacterized membrane-anchored protein